MLLVRNKHDLSSGAASSGNYSSEEEHFQPRAPKRPKLVTVASRCSTQSKTTSPEKPSSTLSLPTPTLKDE
eukprot:11746524-Ditylum_brightwellii.AAC.1